MLDLVARQNSHINLVCFARETHTKLLAYDNGCPNVPVVPTDDTPRVTSGQTDLKPPLLVASVVAAARDPVVSVLEG